MVGTAFRGCPFFRLCDNDGDDDDDGEDDHDDDDDDDDDVADSHAHSTCPSIE